MSANKIDTGQGIVSAVKSYESNKRNTYPIRESEWANMIKPPIH